VARPDGRFRVCRDRDIRGRPEGWYVEDSTSKGVLGRFKFRSDAQEMADKANALERSGRKNEREL
jgi:hypothetical protein